MRFASPRGGARRGTIRGVGRNRFGVATHRPRGTRCPWRGIVRMTGSHEQKPLLKPAPVRDGDGVSIIAPASFARQERIDGGIDRLRALGFAPSFCDNALAREPLFFAGSAEQRLADLHGAFKDLDSTMVMSLRGGYGSNYLLGGLDLDLIRQHPKPFFAYSDLTGV